MLCANCGLRAFCSKNIAHLMDDDECCLQHIWKLRYGNLRNCPHCNKFCTYHRRAGKKCWQCSQCAHQLSPLANTIFHKSKIPLSKWFRAMSIMDGQPVSVIDLRCALRCTYKTAWRMSRRIRTLFANTSLKEYLYTIDHIDHTQSKEHTKRGSQRQERYGNEKL